MIGPHEPTGLTGLLDGVQPSSHLSQNPIESEGREMSNDTLARHGESRAVVMAGTGTELSFAELDERSRRLANAFGSAGIERTGHVALLMENNIRYFEIVFAALRSGLYITPISRHLTAEEALYIINDCGAEALVTSEALGEMATEMLDGLDGVPLRLMVDGVVDGYDSYEDTIAAQSAARPGREPEGALMMYSSGTTGRPKGIVSRLTDADFGGAANPLMALLQFAYSVTEESVYLSPAPLYHAAPLGWSLAVLQMGGMVVVMERFDAEAALRAIEQHRVTHAQFVPTHFVRMLKLDPAVRRRYELSSLQLAVHAAAPCPMKVKQQMMDWWGPIIHEYYAGSEGNGFCAVGPEEWLAHPGTVGRPLIGAIHILDDEGNELGPGEPGQIWFESDRKFEYHNDPGKTAEAFNERGWSSLGDVGYVDGAGYLYLTDRISHMIISGGVNIYPQEVENLLILHPEVVDVAVIGVPNPDMGEEVKAVVIPRDPARVDDDLEQTLMTYCRDNLAHYKCPRSLDFVDELPRTPTGKLLKRKLRDHYASTS